MCRLVYNWYNPYYDDTFPIAIPLKFVLSSIFIPASAFSIKVAGKNHHVCSILNNAIKS